MPKKPEMIRLHSFLRNQEVSLATAFVWQPSPPFRAALRPAWHGAGAGRQTCCFREDRVFQQLVWIYAVFSLG